MNDFEMFQQWLEEHNYCKWSAAVNATSGMTSRILNTHIRKQHAAGTRSKHIMMITAAMQSS